MQGWDPRNASPRGAGARGSRLCSAGVPVQLAAAVGALFAVPQASP
jgi:hypothetical protein